MLLPQYSVNEIDYQAIVVVFGAHLENQWSITNQLLRREDVLVAEKGAAIILQKGEPVPRSGRQEYLENLLSQYLNG